MQPTLHEPQPLALELLDWLAARNVPPHELDALIHALQVIRRCVSDPPPRRRKPRRPVVGNRDRCAPAADVAAIAADAATGVPLSPAEAAPLIDWIITRLEQRGPQTVQELAAAKCTSEKEIKRAIAVAGGRFAWHPDTDTYRLAS